MIRVEKPMPSIILDPERMTFLDVLDTLPLSECLFEKNIATNELGWHAPDGMIFQVSGKFNILHEEAGMQFPIPSVDILIDQYPKEYAQILERNHGNMTTAREDFRLAFRSYDSFEGLNINEECIDEDHWGMDGFIPFDTFSGKWLVLSPNVGEQESHYDDLFNPDQEVRLKIKADVEMYPSWRPKGISINARENQHTALRFSWDEYVYDFSQQYAEGEHEEFEIQLVPSAEQEIYRAPAIPHQGLIIPKRSTEPGAGATSHDYGEIQKMKGRKWDLEMRIDVMRYYRNYVVPFADDIYTTELVLTHVAYQRHDPHPSTPQEFQAQLALVEDAWQQKQQEWEKRNRRIKTSAEKYGETVVFYPNIEIIKIKSSEELF